MIHLRREDRNLSTMSFVTVFKLRRTRDLRRLSSGRQADFPRNTRQQKVTFPPGQILFFKGIAPGPVFFGYILEELDVRIRESVLCLRIFAARVLLHCWVAERLGAASDDALIGDNPKNVSTTSMRKKVMCLIDSCVGLCILLLT